MNYGAQAGWIKLHRQTLNNTVWRRDPTAWRIFEALLMLCDHRTGVWEGGRVQLSEWCGVNNNTAYSALKRLKNAGMINIQSNNKFSIIHICNWPEYQDTDNTSRQQPLNNKSTTTQQRINTLTRSKEIKNKEITIDSGGNGVRPAPWKHSDYLLNLPEADIDELASKFNVHPRAVHAMAEEAHDWYLTNPAKNHKADWKATLRNWIRRKEDELRKKYGSNDQSAEEATPSEYELWVDQQMAAYEAREQRAKKMDAALEQIGISPIRRTVP